MQEPGEPNQGGFKGIRNSDPNKKLRHRTEKCPGDLGNFTALSKDLRPVKKLFAELIRWHGL
jgi:hypothetical protein